MRAADRPRYFATLFAPAGSRPALFALYAFAAELGRLAARVREPLLGEIRLQWWQDQLSAIGQGAAAPTPLLRELAHAIGEHRLDPAALQGIVAARRLELYHEPGAEEAIRDEPEALLFRAAAGLLGASGGPLAEASSAAGGAYDKARQLARRAGSGTGGESDPSIIARAALDDLEAANRALAGVAPDALPAFLPLAAVRPIAARAGSGPPGDFAILARMTAAAATRRVGGRRRIGSALR
ncbi:squalene/phytoene synthase family protein [Propylenella binzhouense]|uniref:squalene/phytoene synthase family protein n=1 Tax=Propylenella binzhouense TaxID=2555902 RepID=UPI0031B5E0D8